MNFRIFHYLLMRRRMIGYTGLVLAMAALIYLLIADPQYKSKALLMPPLEEGSEGLLGAWMAKMNLPSMVVPMAAGTTTAALIVDILESRRLAEMVIESVGLMEWYKVSALDDALRELRSNTAISSSATGMITLSVGDRDPETAQKIALAYISKLDSLNHLLQYTRSENTMEFVAVQIDKYRKRLERSRIEISLFQKEHGIVNFEEQVRGAIDVAAALKTRSVLAEIELDLIREFATDNAIELQRKEMEFEYLTLQMKKLMDDDSTSTVFFPLSKMPQIYQQYAAIERDLQVNEQIYSFLLQRYEESGIEKARTTPSVQIVDMPDIQSRRSGLPIWASVILAALAGWLWASIVLAWWGWISMRDRAAEEENAFNEVVALFRKDIATLRGRFKL
ncbi:MAG: hypothetical protein JW814_01975 [Candidatus Krumholzibacteriota bacterium]|nr:hypothetical protein [Candidatus Krumholzibacteriota bacterium]